MIICVLLMIILLFISIIILDGETPYVVALFAVNSAGAGEVSESLLFTVQGGK